MNRFLKVLTVFALMAATCAVTFAVTYTELSRGSGPAAAKIQEVSAYLDRFFIDEYDREALLAGAADGAAAGMIEATGDRWSYYLNAVDYQAYQEQSANRYCGIGITILPRDGVDGFVVKTVEPGGPAEKAGVQAEDILQQVEGESVLALGQAETVKRVRGEDGTEIQMTFAREGKPYQVRVVRRELQTAVAEYSLTADKKAIITIKNFDAHCAEQTIKAVDQCVADGATGIVFDLRNNPGGMKTELVAVLDHLLPEGILFRSVDYAEKEVIDRSDAACINLPMAVLVNENSYSAAEFFAAALQEYRVAKVVGTQTCGKGNFQNVFPLSDGSAISISIGKYRTPKNVSLTDIGVKPDIAATLNADQFAQLYYHALSPSEDPQLQAALKVLA